MKAAKNMGKAERKSGIIEGRKLKKNVGRNEKSRQEKEVKVKKGKEWKKERKESAQVK